MTDEVTITPMTDLLAATLLPSDQAVESRVGDETVLLHLENGTYYGLDPIGTQIWERLKQGMEPLAICAEIAELYGVALDRVEDDARRFLSDLTAHGILLQK